MKIRIALILALLVPAFSFAERPTTQPNRPLKDGVFGRFPRHENFGPGGKPTQDEIDATIAFAKDKFPNHYDLFSHIPEGTPFHNIVVTKMVVRYRQLMRMQDQNPEVYDAMLKQAQAEDEALGYAREMAAHAADADTKLKDAAEVRLHEAIRAMVDRGLQERRDRIEKLRLQLDDQEKKLNEDEANRDNVIASQIDRIQQEYQRMVQGPRRGGLDNKGDAPQGKEIDALQK
jgi:hypothetical protein